MVVACPQCGRKVTKVSAAVVEYIDPSFSCRCGYKGKLRWEKSWEKPYEQKVWEQAESAAYHLYPGGCTCEPGDECLWCRDVSRLVAKAGLQ